MECFGGKQQEFINNSFCKGHILPFSADQLKGTFSLCIGEELFVLRNEANACYK